MSKRGPHPFWTIGVWAPCGHDIFPKGVCVKYLWDKYGIRFSDFQQVVLSKEERTWFPEMQKQHFPTHYDHGCYQMDREQYAWFLCESEGFAPNQKQSSRVCPVCATSRWIYESTQRIVYNKQLC